VDESAPGSALNRGVMTGHSRPKDGVLSPAYVPAIHVFAVARRQDVDARHKAGHDG